MKIKAVNTEFLATTLPFVLSIVFVCCQSRRDHLADKSTQELFFDYQIAGSEEKQEITFILKYCLGQQQGRGIGIYNPGKVLLDGIPIPPDSSQNNGIYYETIVAKNEFGNSHSIVVNTAFSKKYTETIDFNLLSLGEELPAFLKRNPFYLKIKGCKGGTALRLVLQDTSIKGTGINEMVQVHQDSILINQFMIDRLKSGPILIKIYQDQERALKHTMKPGGLLHILYSLERDFILED